MNTSNSGRSRAAAMLAASALLLAALAGCASGDDVGGSEAERALAMKFMSALESGKASDVAALLTADAPIRSDALDDDFYQAAVARPEHAKLVSIAEDVEPGVDYAHVAYTLGDDPKASVKLAIVDDGGEPRIRDWLKDTVSVDATGPGDLVVNGLMHVNVTEQAHLVLLPGTYTLEFTPAAGGAVSSSPGPATPLFELSWPVDFRSKPTLPGGVELSGSRLTIDG